MDDTLFKPTILSLCDYTGAWSRPWADAGYNVILVDIKHGQDVRFLECVRGPVFAILAAPPCTAFAGSGAQYWDEKDKDGRTAEGLAIVDACMRIILVHKPVVWCLENPVGRLRRWLGPPQMYFHPCDYGDAYTKKTCLWGNFRKPARNPVEPEKVCEQGSWVMQLGGKSERTKELRSVTPPGFAQAFYEANKQ
ncbi:MAG: hypothetical protein KAV00_06960 [Phycisphaerae bacterium]|nr:hypothetical protein [Phycisphaerae bacterium]